MRAAWVIGFQANLGYSESPFSKSQEKKEEKEVEEEDEEEEEEQEQQEERLYTMVTWRKVQQFLFMWSYNLGLNIKMRTFMPRGILH